MSTIGNKLKRLRKFRKKTQEDLAKSVGVSTNGIGRYEIGDRIPRKDVIAKLAQALDVNESAIDNVDVDSDVGLMHLFFYLEDTYGLEIYEIDDKYYLHFDEKKLTSITVYLKAWYEERKKSLGNSENFSAEQKHKYDEWRYTFPEPLIKRTREMIDEYDQTHQKDN